MDTAVLAGLQELEALSGVDLLGPVVAIFCRDSSVSLGAVRTAVEARQTEAVLQALHKLKGSAANVGAVRVAEVCLRWESQAEHGQDPGQTELLGQLAVEVGRAQRDLGAVVAAGRASR